MHSGGSEGSSLSPITSQGAGASPQKKEVRTIYRLKLLCNKARMFSFLIILFTQQAFATPTPLFPAKDVIDLERPRSATAVKLESIEYNEKVHLLIDTRGRCPEKIIQNEKRDSEDGVSKTTTVSFHDLFLSEEIPDTGCFLSIQYTWNAVRGLNADNIREDETVALIIEGRQNSIVTAKVQIGKEGSVHLRPGSISIESGDEPPRPNGSAGFPNIPPPKLIHPR